MPLKEAKYHKSGKAKQQEPEHVGRSRILGGELG